MKLQRILAKELVKAQSEPDLEDVSTLRCLTDERDQRALQKLYKEKCSEEDFSRFPSFLQDIDKVLVKHGGGKKHKKGEQDNDVDEE